MAALKPEYQKLLKWGRQVKRTFEFFPSSKRLKKFCIENGFKPFQKYRDDRFAGFNDEGVVIKICATTKEIEELPDEVKERIAPTLILFKNSKGPETLMIQILTEEVGARAHECLKSDLGSKIDGLDINRFNAGFYDGSAKIFDW